MLSKVGLHPSAHFRWQRLRLAKEFVSKSGVDNSLPYSNLSPWEFAKELLERRIKALENPTKPRVTHAGLGWSMSYVPQVTVAQILGEDTNTRSAVHDTDGKHTPSITPRVTFGIKKHKSRRVSDNQSFPHG